LAVDERNGCIFLEYLTGGTVRDKLRQLYNTNKSTCATDPSDTDLYGSEGNDIATSIGRLVVSLHGTDLVHGDLTTSNMMFSKTNTPTLIDFGLSSTTTSNEDRAVDLYVLERAIASTHPRSEGLIRIVMSVYKNESKHGDKVMQKLADVRARGRKRECFG
jgi:TP53 regulating kinase-like protein